jgi:DNA (cytosine-5)-methyltransferase 1
MNELALFAGAGGGLLASKWLLGWRTICYVENAKYPTKVIKARIRDGLLDDAPIWDDAKTFDGRPWRGCVDIVTAGFPCIPFTIAGKQKAQADERNLWPDTIRIIREVQPRWCLLENVPGLLARSHGYFGTILQELAESGYDAKWRVLSAAELGAPHRRDRVWIVAHATRPAPTGGYKGPRGRLGPQPNANQKGRKASSESPTFWKTEPDVGRVADGVAHRVDKLRALGNGQVPAVVAIVWELLVKT